MNKQDGGLGCLVALWHPTLGEEAGAIGKLVPLGLGGARVGHGDRCRADHADGDGDGDGGGGDGGGERVRVERGQRQWIQKWQAGSESLSRVQMAVDTPM